MKKPQNGFFLFASYDGVLTIEPDYKVCVNDYSCGKTFQLDYLRTLMGPQARIGKLFISTSKAVISVNEGGFIDVKFNLSSGIGGKHNQGGQSQQRFSRKRDDAIKHFFGRVREYMSRVDVDRWEIEGDKNMVKKFSS